MIKDLADWAGYYGVRFNFPDLFPLNGVKPMRGALVAKEKAVRELGIDAGWFMQRIGEQDIKDNLREETVKAVKRGAFGAPTIYVWDKMFWGNDRLIFVEEYLKG